jgi:threonine synthase
MHYYSTKNRELKYGLREALMKGLAPDGGLFMPAGLPILERTQLDTLAEMDLTEIAVMLSGLLFGEDIPPEDLESIARDAVNFDTPLVQVEEDLYCLELFHGPTLAFKDVGARFLARMLGYFTRDLKDDIQVLVATSGDTGSAVANGFLGVEGIRVHVLYPSGLVSPLQEKQFTTLGDNITAVEVEGTFDDCQKLVKEAFMDDELTGLMNLTSANSINLARFLPQAFYYFRGWGQLKKLTNGDQDGNRELFFSVPSGNYGNMTAGLVAREMGLPVHTFISANNINDVVPSYLLTGKFKPRPSTATLANAMDVGNPSNFDRILDLFDHRHERITRHMEGFSYTDHDIRKIIAKVFRDTGYLCDPHGATGYQAARDYLDAAGGRTGAASQAGLTGIFLETAHPAKFRECVEEVTGTAVDLPERLAAFSSREKVSVRLKPDYQDFRAYLRG